MKKKIIILFMALAMCFAFAGCGGQSGESSSESDSSEPKVEVEAEAPATEAEPQEAETDENAAESAASEAGAETSTIAEGEGDIGDFHVVINGAKKDVDYEGNPVIVVTYTWTNNSEETTSPMVSVLGKAFQDGVEMEYGILDHEYNDGMTDVRPGTSIEADAVFCMTGDSVVEFEISALSDMFMDPVPKVVMNFDPASLEQ